MHRPLCAPWPAVLTLASLIACHRPSTPPPGTVVQLTSPSANGTRLSARAGDLALRGTDGTTLTFAAAPDLDAQRPVRGALIDVEIPISTRDVPHQDPIAWWRPTWFDAAGQSHPLVATRVEPTLCARGAAGVRASGITDGVALESTVCARAGGGYTLTTRARSPLPPRAQLGDEIDAGTAQIALERTGWRWSGPTHSRFIVLSEPGLSVGLEARAMLVRRNDAPTADELSRAVLYVMYPGSTPVERTLYIAAGDPFDALERLALSTRAVTLRGARSFDLLDAAGEPILSGEIPPTAVRSLRLPPDLGTSILFRDERGVPAPRPVPLARTVNAPAIVRTNVQLRYADERGHALPVHVLFHGLDGTPDPTPQLVGHGYHAGRSVYLLDGTGEIALAPGRYRVTASHGVRYGLSVREIDLRAGESIEVTGTVPEIVRTADYVAGDFHLHASPSPDSHVTLAERIAALLCEGVDFAVATDHNHVTDYGPSVQTLDASASIATLPGEEITTFAPHWGHFNAYPMVPGGARSEGIVAFYGTTPQRIFASAREHGARVIQVNHPRMLPAMGYFNFTRFDPATGRADPSFAPDFNAIEVFNGWQIEHPEHVRAVLRDVVGLVRRGLHPALTGNSDSHYLLYEEAGYPRTYVQVARDPVSGRAERVVDGMLHGRTTVSSGPFVQIEVEGKGPGETVRPNHGHVAVHVRVQAPAWVPVEGVEVWLDDQIAQRFAVEGPAVDGVRFDRTLSLELGRDAVLTAWADAQTPLPDVLPYPHAIGLGFTGFVYVDADGDGTVSLPEGAPRGPGL